MREKIDAAEDSTAEVVGRVPWDVTAVSVLPGYRLQVRFADGAEGVVDLSRMVLGRNPGVFESLRDAAIFAQARIEHGAVTWPGELDLAPDAMHAEILANGRWDLSE
jgi:hypothetical protein